MEFTVSTDAATYDWSSTASDFREYSAEGEGSSIPLRGADPFAAELAYFADCVLKNVQLDRCPPAQSVMAVALIARMLESRESNS